MCVVGQGDVHVRACCIEETLSLHLSWLLNLLRRKLNSLRCQLCMYLLATDIVPEPVYLQNLPIDFLNNNIDFSEVSFRYLEAPLHGSFFDHITLCSGKKQGMLVNKEL